MRRRSYMHLCEQPTGQGRAGQGGAGVEVGKGGESQQSHRELAGKSLGPLSQLLEQH